MSIVILGDPHIGKGLSLGKTAIGAALNSRVIDQSNLLDWTLKQTEEIGSSNIIITGDIFEDPKPHPSLIALFVSWLKKCYVHGIHVHNILGNHDILRSGNYYTSPLDIISESEMENVSIYKNIETILIDNLAITLFPFRDRKSFGSIPNADALNLLKDSLVYELASIPINYKKLLVGHLTLEGSIPVGDEIDDLTNELFCPLDMFAGYDYVIMGHVHKPQVLMQKPYIAHIGSMDLSNFGETDHCKHLIILDMEANEPISYLPIPTRPLKKISIQIPAEIQDTTQYVKDELEKNKAELNKAIVRVELHLTNSDLISVDRSNVEKYLYQLGVNNISGISQSKKITLLKPEHNNKILDTAVNVNTAVKMYANLLDEKKRPAFIELAMEIYQDYKTETKF